MFDFDDTIIPKPYMDMDENEIRWHCDYSHGRNEKGINRLTAFYHSQPFNASETLRVPVSYECVKKTVHYCDCDLKARKEKRQSEVSKNDGVLRNITNRLNKNASLAKSPARTVTTQGNHLFASLAAYVKLERLKLVHKLNHFALKAKIYWAVSKDAWSELKKIKLEASA
ncbi:MAG: hypothetical protein LBC20_03415 [Planctomycetaceae bacterium]|nr:hypothetical protein [Planctomycetaceae bacterium]